MNDDDVERRADRILDDYRDVIEWYWEESGRQGMGRRFIQAVEVLRPDGLVVFAFRPTPWEDWPNPLPWQEGSIVVVVRLIEGTAVRSIPCPPEG